MSDISRIRPSRRDLLAGVSTGTAALAMPAVWSPSRAAGKRIVVRDDGGIYSKAYTAVFYKPFTQVSGIEVVGVQANAEPTAQIKSMVDTKSYTWDMAKIPAEYMNPYGVGTNVYCTVLAFRTDAFKGRRAPASWADLWNVKDVPGRRAMRKFAFDTIEEALMGAGVPIADVYPCDRAKAFASLDRIKPSVDVWWTSGAQVEQMLESGEVDMLPTWISRAQSAQAAGAPVEVVWNQNIWGCDSWSILAGTPNADACRDFIKFASDPKRQAALTEYFPAGVTQPEAFNHIKADIARNCPSAQANIKSGLKIDATYWLDNQAAMIERFNAWILT